MFETPESLVEATKRARDDGYRDLDCFTPFPVYELFPVLRLRDDRVQWLGLFGGIFAGCGRRRAFEVRRQHSLEIRVDGAEIEVDVARRRISREHLVAVVDQSRDPLPHAVECLGHGPNFFRAAFG